MVRIFGYLSVFEADTLALLLPKSKAAREHSEVVQAQAPRYIAEGKVLGLKDSEGKPAFAVAMVEPVTRAELLRNYFLCKTYSSGVSCSFRPYYQLTSLQVFSSPVTGSSLQDVNRFLGDMLGKRNCALVGNFILEEVPLAYATTLFGDGPHNWCKGRFPFPSSDRP